MPSGPTFTSRLTPTGRQLGLISTYPPKLCGLATFAAALERSLTDAGEGVTVVTIGDGSPSPHRSHGVRPELLPGNPSSLRAAAGVLSRCDVAIVQHEYGIYGGRDGDEVLELLRLVEAPTIVVLHTVPATPTPSQRFVLESVAALASVVVVMTDAAAARLLAGYSVDADKVVTIPHGAWALSRTGLVAVASPEQPVRMLTWGLLGPGKGIEHVIRALSALGPTDRPVQYTVAGATHPNVLAREGQRYRESLMELALEHGVRDAVRFDDAYHDLETLGRLVRSADLVILPYDSRDQVTSGVLVDAVAAGKPVIATAFPHAIELLSSGAGVVVPHRDADALAGAIRRAVNEPAALAAMSRRARELAPELAWSSVADRYRHLCDQLVRDASKAAV
jgi:glycosyltransferase involved in cell wall biosynthesis